MAFRQKYWFTGSELYDGKVLFRGKVWRDGEIWFRYLCAISVNSTVKITVRRNNVFRETETTRSHAAPRGFPSFRYSLRVFVE